MLRGLTEIKFHTSIGFYMAIQTNK